MLAPLLELGPCFLSRQSRRARYLAPRGTGPKRVPDLKSTVANCRAGRGSTQSEEFKAVLDIELKPPKVAE